jgi:hypothetical protein
MVYDARYALLALGLSAITPSGAGQAGKGLTMTMTMTMSTPMQPQSVTMFMAKAQISSSGKGRTDYLPTDASKAMPQAPPATGDRPPMLRVGTYTLNKRANDTTLVVDPSQHKVWVLLKSDRPPVSPVHESYTSVAISSQRVMPDSAVGGITVQHWRVTDNHTQTRMIFKGVYDIYSAPDFDPGGFNPASSLSSFGKGDTAYAEKLHAAMAQAMVGYPLRMTMQMNMMDSKGKTTTVSMAMTVTNIIRGDPPADIFVVPAGYTTVRGSLFTTSAGTTGDTAHKASILDTAAKQAGANAATDANNAVQQKVKSMIHFP